MKKLLSILTLLFVALTAYGQAEKSIVIDQNSFRPVQTDAVTGVGVDEILADDSRRPCARIKVRINRMAVEDVNKLEVKIATNNQLTKFTLHLMVLVSARVSFRTDSGNLLE